MERKVVNREEATRQSSHSPPQVDNANESVEARLGALPVSKGSRYAVIYAVIGLVEPFDGSNNFSMSAAGADMQR